MCSSDVSPRQPSNRGLRPSTATWRARFPRGRSATADRQVRRYARIGPRDRVEGAVPNTTSSSKSARTEKKTKKKKTEKEKKTRGASGKRPDPDLRQLPGSQLNFETGSEFRATNTSSISIFTRLARATDGPEENSCSIFMKSGAGMELGRAHLRGIATDRENVPRRRKVSKRKKNGKGVVGGSARKTVTGGRGLPCLIVNRICCR